MGRDRDKVGSNPSPGVVALVVEAGLDDVVDICFYPFLLFISFFGLVFL